MSQPIVIDSWQSWVSSGIDYTISETESSSPNDESRAECNTLLLSDALEVTTYKHDLFHALGLTKVYIVGRGASGDVIKAAKFGENYREVAVKRFPVDSGKGMSRMKQFMREVSITKQLKHPNIISGLIPTVCPGYAAIVMDFYPEGSLDRYLADYSGAQVERFFGQLASCMVYLQAQKVAHRDIKPDNILLKGTDTIVMCDFGMATQVEDSQLWGYCGTRLFMAPEVRDSRESQEVYNAYLADAYSCGAVMWALLMREYPKEETLLASLTANFAKVDPFLRYFPQRLLQQKPEERQGVLAMLAEMAKNKGIV